MAVRIALTGTGYIAKIHAQAIQNTLEAEIVAVANHRPESMQAFAAEFGISRQCPDVDALLADGDVDALVVCTPNYLHAPQAIAALKAGVHVMVEKPMAMNAAEAKTMLEASQASGVLLMVAHCWRFHPEVLWLREQVEAGRMGKIVRTKGYGVHVNWGPAGWFTQKEFAGGGAMADMGIHAVDTARFLLGDPQPVSVYARIGTYYKDLEVDDTGVVIVNWENDIASYLESGWWQPYSDGREATTQLYGTSGFGQIFPVRLIVPSARPFEAEEVEIGYTPVGDSGDLQVMYDAQVAYFVKCLREGRQPNPGGAEGLVNMRVVDAAYKSAESGEVIKL
ncbi:MAG: Gfo/Idh/MocA family oxidoreductase [Anaerolineae bacterium]